MNRLEGDHNKCYMKLAEFGGRIRLPTLRIIKNPRESGRVAVDVYMEHSNVRVRYRFNLNIRYDMAYILFNNICLLLK